MRVSLDNCRLAVAAVLESAGLRRERAGELAELLVVTQARGVWSHGVNLTHKYAKQIQGGTLEQEPAIRVQKQSQIIAKLDGDRGLGVTVVTDAVARAMEMARNTGVGIVTFTNLQHYAAGLYYAQRPVQQGMIFLMVANSPASMAPYGGTEKYYGTNPFTFAAPMGKYPAYCLDMATTAVAGNKLENAMNLGERVPYGLGLDRNHQPSQDPGEILYHGCLLPFGGMKGSGIAGMVNILGGLLSGGAYGADVNSMCTDSAKPANYGGFVLVLDIAHFMDMEIYTARAENWVEGILRNPPAEGFDRVVYPGYPEEERWQDAVKNGLELGEIAIQKLKLAGELTGVDVMALLQPENKKE